ncbi:unnamed protein product [Sphagnum balticum]
MASNQASNCKFDLKKDKIMTMLTHSASVSSYAIAAAFANSASKRATRTLDTHKANPFEERFGDFIDSTIIGQENARRAARRAVRRTVSKLRAPNQPYYVILAPGPTTSGKSELAYRLGEFFHGNRLAVLKLDGSEYGDKISLSRAVGASPNYAGYTNRKEKDYVAPLAHEVDYYAALSQHNLNRSRMGSQSNVTIVLIDEWDKVCKEFNEILLSIFREGRYTLGNGEVVDFTNCIFVLTANLGASAVEDAKNHRGMGFNAQNSCSDEDADKIIDDHLRAFAPPEFRARIEENGEICIFHALSAEQIASLSELKIKELCARIEKEAGITIKIEATAREWLLAKSRSVSKLNGAMKSDIIDVLDNEIAKNEIGKGNVVHILRDAENDELRFEVESIITTFDPEEIERLLANQEDPLTTALRTASMPNAKDQALSSSGESPKQDTTPDKTTPDNATVDKAEATAISEAVLTQPFTVQFACPDRETLVKVRTIIYEAIEASPHAVALSGDMRYVAPFIATFQVSATLEAIVALKAQYPAVTFSIVGGEIS